MLTRLSSYALVLAVLTGVMLAQSPADTAKIDEFRAYLKALEAQLTPEGITNARNIATRLNTLKGQFKPVPPPIPPPVVTPPVEPPPVEPPPPITVPVGDHGYFDMLLKRSDCFKALSFRPVAGQTIATAPGAADLQRFNTNCSHAFYGNQLKGLNGPDYGYRNSAGFYIGETGPRVTYAPATDTHPQAQDAAKVRIPAFTRACPDSQPNGCVLAADMDAEATSLVFSGSPSGFDGSIGRAVKVDDEIMLIVVPSNTTALAPKTVKRGQFGTTAAAHKAGTSFSITTNSLDIRDGIRFPIRTDGTETATYLITWDAFHAEPGWIGWTGQNQAYKQFQLSSSGRNDRFFEFEPRFDACGTTATSPVKHLGCIPGTHIGSAGARLYAPLMAPISNRYPGAPVKEPFLIEASKWIRYWLKVEAQNETTGYFPVTTLSAALDAAATTVQISFPASTFPAIAGNPFYDGQNAGAGTDFPGRGVKIGAEIVTVSTCQPAASSVLTCTVARGAYGTTAQSHASGASVGLSFDYVTLIMADDDTDATVVYDRLPMYLGTRHSDPKMRGSIEQFWLEFDTSGGDAYPLRYAQQWADWAFYVRNLAILKNPGDVAPLLVRPSK